MSKARPVPEAKALICHEDQSFSLESISLAPLGATDILVRNEFSGVSLGTEFALVHGKVSYGPFPICLGYQAVGIVERVGPAVRDLSPGQRVYWRLHKPFTLADGSPVSPTCGSHCSHAIVEPSATHGPMVLPDNVDPAVASLFVMPAVGLHGVNMAGVSMGDRVVVQGAGLIGLGSINACALRGAEVLAIDMDAKRVAMAGEFGAAVTFNANDGDIVERVTESFPGGADVVIEATGVGALVDVAMRMVKPEGTFIFQGNYGLGPLPFEFMVPHAKQVRAFFPSDDGYHPCERAVMRLLAMGVLPLDKAVTHRVAAADAPAFYHAINQGESSDVCGAVIRWGAE
jgi:2-desacetyl-2-hydroxyethyl bacteriochlorophyllide A dehydrogenase